jgi:spermidine/putrescine transport system permease protein
MSSNTFLRIWVGLFVLLFFLYLFGPLILMSFTAFNTPSFPRALPWECFTLEWFSVLANDQDLMAGLQNSIFIGLGVVLVAVPLGLAGALLLTQIPQRVRPYYYTIVISPILIPGVVLGISTLIFWDRLGAMFDASYDSLFYDGIFLTIIGQATFVSAYAMLVFIARLQRFDHAQEEAALDLGASHTQAFRKILLPFLKPAIASASVLAFLASFENYNTTIFTITSEKTLTTVLASKVRYGINPSISSLAVIIVALTLIGAVVHEALRRREARLQQGIAAKPLNFGNPTTYIILLVFLAGLSTTWMSTRFDTASCKVDALEQKRLETQRRVQELQQRRMFESGRPPNEQTPQTKQATPVPDSQAPESYPNIFAPQNLAPLQDATSEQADTPTSNDYPSIFAPQNLAPEKTE